MFAFRWLPQRMKSNSLIIFAWNITLVLLGILGVELFFGHWLKTSANPPRVMPKGGVRYDRIAIENAKRFIEKFPNTNQTTVHPAKNAIGKCTVLVLGGSTTEDIILTKPEMWTGKYHKKINREVPKHLCRGGVEVINAGVGGHSTLANFGDLKHWLITELDNANLVVVYQGINDNHDGFSLSSKRRIIYGLMGASVGPVVFDFLSDIRLAIIYNSAIFDLYTRLRSHYDSSNHDPKYGFTKQNGKEYVVIKKQHSQPPRARDIQTVGISESTISKVKSSLAYQKYQLHINKLYSLILDSGAGLIVITQTFPVCDIRSADKIVFANLATSEYLSEDYAENLSQDEILQIAKNGMLQNFFGMCWRVKLNSDAQREVADSLKSRYPNKIQFLDYAATKKLHLNEMSMDLYHRDPNATHKLFQDFIDFGLIEKTLHLLNE